MSMPVITLAAEGLIDIAVCRRIAFESGFEPGNEYGGHGKSKLDERLNGYNAAAMRTPWLVARDMDHDGRCPGALVAKLLPSPSQLICFRIAVRTIESWLLADCEAFSERFSVTEAQLPRLPEQLENPKQFMLALLFRSRSREVLATMVHEAGDGALRVGAQYNSTFSHFAGHEWRPEIAAVRAGSLRASLRRLAELRKKLKNS